MAVKCPIMKYAICNETFRGWEWERTCAHVAELGYRGIEIAPFTLAEDVRAINPRWRGEVAAAARNTGLEIVGLHWFLVSPKGLSITSDDYAVRAETADYLAALKTAPRCRGPGPGARLAAQRRLPAKGATEIAAEGERDSALRKRWRGPRSTG